MNNGRDCPHGRQVGKCDTCDLIDAEKEIESLNAQVERLQQELTLSTDQNDLLLDEFIRVKHLTDNGEIHGLCERAHVRMRQKVSVIDRNFKQAEEIKQLKSQVERLREFAELIVEWKEYGFEKAKILLDATPSQCLAEHDREVAAKAIEKAADELASLITAPAGMHTAAIIKLNLYANKIKSGEVKL